ncbi:hypothetical protein BDW69DRAFT_181340 [Aspergillus filifer]
MSCFKSLILMAAFALVALASQPGKSKPIRDGPILTLTGTIEKVHAQLREINPNYDEDWKNVPESDDFSGFSPSTVIDVLKAAADQKVLSCSKASESTANRKRIEEGIDYLRKRKGQVTVTTYPTYRCSRVSCSYNSAIFWCNESKMDLTLDSTKPIADAAPYVLDNCNYPKRDQVKGHAVYPGAWRTILQGSDCLVMRRFEKQVCVT